MFGNFTEVLALGKKKAIEAMKVIFASKELVLASTQHCRKFSAYFRAVYCPFSINRFPGNQLNVLDGPCLFLRKARKGSTKTMKL